MLILGWDNEESVLVCMNEVTRPDGAPKDLDFTIPTHRMDMSMAYTKAPGESAPACARSSAK